VLISGDVERGLWIICDGEITLSHGDMISMSLKIQRLEDKIQRKVMGSRLMSMGISIRGGIRVWF
jgi:hypothetical protein